FDSRRRKLIILCGYDENHLVKAMPSRRFNARNKRWEAAMCRKNIEYLQARVPYANFTKEGSEAIVEHRSKLKERDKTPFPHNYPFKTAPFPHQAGALDFCHNRDVSALFMEMGTGKSKVAVDKASNHAFQGDIGGLLIFCPVSIRRNWVEQ